MNENDYLYCEKFSGFKRMVIVGGLILGCWMVIFLAMYGAYRIVERFIP